MKFVIAEVVNNKFSKYSLEETKSLIESYGGVIDNIFLQNRDYASSASYIGTGKAKEIAEYCLENKIDVLVINNMIRPSVYNTLRDYFGYETQIWDKVDLILNIFERHSKTHEAKLQIEFARIRYELPRLKGRGKQLSNLGAGIGTRGPGETIKEIKKRDYEKRLNQIKKEIKQRQKVLLAQRLGRKNFKNAVFVGYSNVGKSTLFQTITGKEVFIKDVLFATLDNRISKIKTQYPNDYLVVDTIGFINGIPPLLVNSFLPILEELKFANTVIFTLDISLLETDKEYFNLQFDTIVDVLKGFAGFLEHKDILLAFNKADLLNQKIDDKILKSYTSKLQDKLNFLNDIDYWIGSSFDKKSLEILKEKIIKI